MGCFSCEGVWTIISLLNFDIFLDILSRYLKVQLKAVAQFQIWATIPVMTSKKLVRSLLSFASLPLILFPINSFAIQADIKDISDDKYFQAVHDQLTGAKDSIYIAMYERYLWS